MATTAAHPTADKTMVNAIVRQCRRIKPLIPFCRTPSWQGEMPLGCCYCVAVRTNTKGHTEA